MVIFLVENQLFKVHRYFFRQESVIFESMFDCPVPGEGQEGQTDSKPIEIPDVTCAQFEALLDHFYDGLFRKEDYFNRDTPLQKYIDLLSISHRFECSTARERAIKGIDNATTNPIQMIELAEVYDVPKWLLPAYVELCQREDPLDETEAIDLGPQKTVVICRAREIIRSSPETRRLLKERTTPSSTFGGGFGSVTVSESPTDSQWPESVLQKSRVERIINEVLTPPATTKPTPRISSIFGQNTTQPIKPLPLSFGSPRSATHTPVLSGFGSGVFGSPVSPPEQAVSSRGGTTGTPTGGGGSKKKKGKGWN
ncbi:hypothetical protein VNI00_000230 [Paramarasmius palmivorus]|uniref:BTB domain-containing protein n=1 Tax=Paramarasmius palmivorus TaxID=297713 RepID=A0AAW0EEE4_9AGAR